MDLGFPEGIVIESVNLVLRFPDGSKAELATASSLVATSTVRWHEDVDYGALHTDYSDSPVAVHRGNTTLKVEFEGQFIGGKDAYTTVKEIK
jgi:hypothetical protein